MTISSIGSRAVYNGSGSTGPFSLIDKDSNPILFYSNDEIVVTKFSTLGVPSVLTLTVDYTLTGAGSGTAGSVTLVTALASGEQLVILRDTARTQTVDLASGNRLNQTVFENHLDKMARIEQEDADTRVRAVKMPINYVDEEIDMPLPAAGAYIGWNDDADGLENKDILNSLHSGFGAPLSSLGIDGDTYIDTYNKMLYGPKVAGEWGVPYSLVGPIGPEGPIATDFLTPEDADLLYYKKTNTTSPNGFPNRTELTMSWSDATRTLTVSPVASEFTVWSNGVDYTKTTVLTSQIPDAEGTHYYYFDDNGDLVNTQTFGTNLILRWAIVAIVHWNATDKVAVPDAQLEWHGTDWPPEVHLQQHLVAGCRYESGLATTVTAEADGSSLSHIQADITSGYIWDEDIRHAIGAHAAADNITILHRSGASGLWSATIESSAIVRNTGSGRAAYNQFTGVTWQQTEMTEGYFGVAYVYSMPSFTSSKQTVIIQGQGQYATQGEAGAAAITAPDLGGLPLYEVKLIAAIVFQTSSGLANAAKSRIMRIGDSAGADYVDWRYESAVVQVSGGSLADGYNIIAAGTQTAFSAGSVLFQNSNGVTFGMSNNSVITASVAAGGPSDGYNIIAAGTQTAATTGTVVFSNSNGMSFGMSNNSVVTGSYTVPSTAGLLSAVKISGGTSSANMSAITFSNSNGISFGLNGSVITGSVATSLSAIRLSAGTSSANLSAVTFSNSNGMSFGLNGSVVTGSYTVPTVTNSSCSVSAGTTSGTISQLFFSNSNGISFGLNAGTITASHSVPTITSATISAGTTSGTLSNLVFSNSNNFSFGMNAGTITCSYTVPSVPAQTNQTLGIYGLSNTTGQSSSSTIDARSLSFVGAGVASIGMSGGSVVVSVPSGGGAGDGYNILAAGTQTATTAGSVKFENSNGISFGMSGSTQITASYTVPSTAGHLSAVNVSAGTTSNNMSAMTFSNSNGLSFGLNGSVITGSYTVPSTAGHLSAINVSGGTTSNNLSAITFSNSNGLAFGLNGSVMTGSYTVPTVTNSSATISAGTASATLSNLIFSNSNGVSFGFNAGTITGSVATSLTAIRLSAGTSSANLSAMTFSNSNGMSFGLNGSVVTGSYTVPTVTNSSATISAGTQSVTLGQLVFSNSNGLTFGMNAGTVTGSYTVPAAQTNQTLGLYAAGNTTGQSSSSTFDARTLSFVGQGIASVGFSNGSVNISVPSGGGAGDGVNILAAGTQTANTTGTVAFSNSNGISFGMSNSSVITASYTVPSTTVSFVDSNNVSFGINGGTQITASFAMNVSAGAASNNLSALQFSNANGVSFGLNAGTITASAAAGGGGAPDRHYIEIMNGERLTSCAALSATQWSNRPMLFPFWMDGTGIEVKTMRYLVSGVGSSNRSFGGTFRVGIYSQVNETQLTLLCSDSQSFSITVSSHSTYWNGMNVMDFTGMSTCTLTAEGRYVAAFQIAPVSANATWMSAALWGGDNMPAISRFLIAGTTSATNNTSKIFPWWGVYSTTSAGLPNSIAQTQVLGGNSASLADAYCIIKDL